MAEREERRRRDEIREERRRERERERRLEVGSGLGCCGVGVGLGGPDGENAQVLPSSLAPMACVGPSSVSVVVAFMLLRCAAPTPSLHFPPTLCTVRTHTQAANQGGAKKSKITRDRERDISEKVALGMANVGGGGEVQYDQRLFNQVRVEGGRLDRVAMGWEGLP